jgi:hypothetical protein
MPLFWAEICKIAHQPAQFRGLVAFFATKLGSFALAQWDQLRHLEPAFQASSPKLFKPGTQCRAFFLPA